jgi:cellobiose-specific phosphotransferase system component IIC
LFRTNVGSIPTAYIDNDLTTANSSDYANYQSGTYSIGRSSSTELFINFAGTGSTSAL